MEQRPRGFLACSKGFSAIIAAVAVPALLVFGAALSFAEEPAPAKLSVLATKPNWDDLERFQRTITRADFVRLLDTLYAPDDAWKGVISIRQNRAVIHAPGSSKPEFILNFAPSAATAAPIPRYWKPPGAVKAKDADKPLEGYTIALDPGHLGGRWAKMEERWFQIGDSKPIAEGDMVLAVAKLLDTRLTNAGAKVVYLRSSTDPVTPKRPHDFKELAKSELERKGITLTRDTYDGPADPLKENSIQWQSELLFYRVSEIRHRAERVNKTLKPDLTICLHFNAEDWGDPTTPTLTDKDHLHMLVNGTYGPGELAKEDIRHEMLVKLLGRSGRVELPLSKRVGESLAQATGLPAFEYKGGNARAVTDGPYVWARNLLATRLYECPVVYCEPHVMNSQTFFDRFQLGEYEGTRTINGVERKSVFNEYADAVAAGVVRYFREKQ